MTKLDKYLAEVKSSGIYEMVPALKTSIAMVELLRDALEFECGGTCARGINPCNARETLDKLEELASE